MGQAVEGNVFILGKPRRPPESKHVIEFKLEPLLTSYCIALRYVGFAQLQVQHCTTLDLGEFLVLNMTPFSNEGSTVCVVHLFEMFNGVRFTGHTLYLNYCLGALWDERNKNTMHCRNILVERQDYEKSILSNLWQQEHSMVSLAAR